MDNAFYPHPNYLHKCNEISCTISKTDYNDFQQHNLIKLKETKMHTIEKQVELVANWGFTHDVSGIWYRKEFKGWLEQWSENHPEVIKFFTTDENGQSTFNHDYKIDWSLFN